jgi:uncharacterized protein
MLVLTLALAVLVGIVLGLLGGGGSILTLPILSYVAGMETKPAIASSLFVVAVTSAFAAIGHARAGRVRWRTAISFGVAGMVGAYGGGRLAARVPDVVLMVMFAFVMIAAGAAMLRRRMPLRHTTAAPSLVSLAGQGMGVGLVAGLVGAGGGFLIVPALVFLGGLGMEAAVGTSLVVISMQSTAGFAGHLAHVRDLEWSTTLAVTAVAVIGSLLGTALAKRVSPQKLRTTFGVFVLAIAGLVLARELL